MECNKGNFLPGLIVKIIPTFLSIYNWFNKYHSGLLINLEVVCRLCSCLIDETHTFLFIMYAYYLWLDSVKLKWISWINCVWNEPTLLHTAAFLVTSRLSNVLTLDVRHLLCFCCMSCFVVILEGLVTSVSNLLGEI